MRKRVKVYYEDGTRSYAELETSGKAPKMIVGGMDYDLQSFAATGAVVAVNDQDVLNLLLSNGISARPTKQTTITISVSESLKERIDNEAKRRGWKVTKLLVTAVEEWMDNHK